MKERSIFASEWKLMEFLWEDAPRTLMEIVRAMGERVGWAKSTVTTMVARMEGKGLLRYETEGRTKKFYPTLTREEAMSAEADSLLQKAFHGSASLLVSSFLESKRLSREEIDELYAMLKKAEDALEIGAADRFDMSWYADDLLEIRTDLGSSFVHIRTQ